MKTLVLVIALACSFALAQNWEYAIYQVFERSSGSVHSYFDRTGETTGHARVEDLFAAIGRRVSMSAYGTVEDVAVLNYLGFRGWEVWRVTEKSEAAGVMVRYYLKKPR